MSTLTISFNKPNDDPGKYRVSYRPKGSTQPYFVINSTLVPVTISTNIIKNVDYEGFVQSVCSDKNSKGKIFNTSKYNNATGSISVFGNDDSPIGKVTSVKFKNSQLLPLKEGIVLSPGIMGDFIANVQGTGDLVVNHSFIKCKIKIIDSSSVAQEQIITSSSFTFHNVIINSSKVFVIQITPQPLPI